jgi:5-methylcytosine-specific restriction endonuclease McrA
MNLKKKLAHFRSIGFDGKCMRCGSKENITLHHRFPKRNGTQHSQTNLPRKDRYEAICKSCHNKINQEQNKRLDLKNKNYTKVYDCSGDDLQSYALLQSIISLNNMGME